jgi:hypothetical protein
VGLYGQDQYQFWLVGNFLEWRLYTKQKGQTEYHQFSLRQVATQEDKLDEMILLLKKSSLLRCGKKTSGLEDLISQSQIEQAEITKRFYEDYKALRGKLFEHLVEENQELKENKDFNLTELAEKFQNSSSPKDCHSLNKVVKKNVSKKDLPTITNSFKPKNTHKHRLLEKTQKILDRMIFVMFCEDNNLLPMYTVKNTYDKAMSRFSRSQTKVWDEFLSLFDGIDRGFPSQNIPAYNGGLFAPDSVLEKLILKDYIFKDFVKLAEYFFDSDLDVNILGHIFEQSISDIEEIKAELEDQDTDKKKSKRKKDGIYYTPSYITDYIVQETVGSYLRDNPQKLKSIKILDPAGDSGAFPNQIHSYLTKKTAEAENQKAVEEGLGQLAQLNQSIIDKGILKNNIFMVDLQSESVEIAKLSLWLKTARKDQKLNNLDGNVKAGNSLIDDPELAGDKAFDWERKFGHLRNDKNNEDNQEK